MSRDPKHGRCRNIAGQAKGRGPQKAERQQDQRDDGTENDIQHHAHPNKPQKPPDVQQGFAGR